MKERPSALDDPAQKKGAPQGNGHHGRQHQGPVKKDSMVQSHDRIREQEKTPVGDRPFEWFDPMGPSRFSQDLGKDQRQKDQFDQDGDQCPAIHKVGPRRPKVIKGMRMRAAR